MSRRNGSGYRLKTAIAYRNNTDGVAGSISGNTIQKSESCVVNQETINEWLNYSLITLGDVDVRVSGVLAAFAALIFTMLASRVLRRGLDVLSGRRESMNAASVYTIKRVVHYAFIALGILVALSFLGLDMSKMAIIAGALGVGIGFGLQSIVNNFVSGIIILFDRTLKVGDFMELASGRRGCGVRCRRFIFAARLSVRRTTSKSSSPTPSW